MAGPRDESAWLENIAMPPMLAYGDDPYPIDTLTGYEHFDRPGGYAVPREIGIRMDEYEYMSRMRAEESRMLREKQQKQTILDLIECIRLLEAKIAAKEESPEPTIEQIQEAWIYDQITMEQMEAQLAIAIARQRPFADDLTPSEDEGMGTVGERRLLPPWASILLRLAGGCILVVGMFLPTVDLPLMMSGAGLLIFV